VRQVVPDARVLAVRVAHSDGVAYQGDLICALGLLTDQIAAAEEGDMAAMIDVVSMSLGYFSESVADAAYGSGLWEVIDRLLSMAVVVVAGPGDCSKSSKFYPAAFAQRSTPGHVPPVSAGALNPHGSKAGAGDDDRWITAGTACGPTRPTRPVRSPQ
jgi:hypothetical protein